jgi:UDPglucose 6-dehydrogenase
MERIAVVGVGYVGLVSAACLAEVGYTVVCLDIDQKKIGGLRSGVVPIFEPGLESMVQRNSSEGRLLFTCDYREAIAGTKIAVLAVDTPTGGDGLCDLRNIHRAGESLADAMTGDMVVVIKSTVPVGTSAHVGAIIQRRLTERGVSFYVEMVSNPEFLREGAAVHDFMHPDRVVIGVSSERAEEVMRDLYRPFCHSAEKFILMDTPSSEMTKYAANTMLACRISYMNWLSRLCEATGADIGSVKTGIGSDTRIGPAFLHAGIGFGGSCFPKDIRALQGMAREKELSCALIEAIDLTNEEQKEILGHKIERYFDERGGIQGKTIAVLGLAFKPDTDDMREAPSLVLVRQLIEAGASVRLFDPVAMDNAKRLVAPSPGITWCDSEWSAVSDADAIALATEWSRFRDLDLHRLRTVMRGSAFFDGRNLFSPDEMGRKGFDYVSIGRPPVFARSGETSEPAPVLFSKFSPLSCS